MSNPADNDEKAPIAPSTVEATNANANASAGGSPRENDKSEGSDDEQFKRKSGEFHESDLIIEDEDKLTGLERLIEVTDFLYLLGFMTGFVVAAFATQAALLSEDKRLEKLLPWYVGVGACVCMTFAAMLNFALKLYGVYTQKREQIPFLRDQSAIVTIVNQELNDKPEVLEGVGLPTDFEVKEPTDDYDVGMPWHTLILLAGGSSGVLGGAILVAAENPFYGLTLMFTCSILLKLTSADFYNHIENITKLIERDNQALVSVAGILKCNLPKTRVTKVKTGQIDLSEGFTFGTLAEAMMTNKHMHQR